MSYTMENIFKTGMILLLTRNIFILSSKLLFGITGITEIFFSFLLFCMHVFLYFNSKKKASENHILVILILLFFYIFKEYLFFYSIYKIIFISSIVLIEYCSCLYIHKMEIVISLKELIKIFLISFVVYFFPKIFMYLYFKYFYLTSFKI